MPDIDPDMHYYRRRLFEEQKRALDATTKEAGAAHHNLATLYQQHLILLNAGASRRSWGRDQMKAFAG